MFVYVCACTYVCAPVHVNIGRIKHFPSSMGFLAYIIKLNLFVHFLILGRTL